MMCETDKNDTNISSEVEIDINGEYMNAWHNFMAYKLRYDDDPLFLLPPSLRVSYDKLDILNDLNDDGSQELTLGMYRITVGKLNTRTDSNWAIYGASNSEIIIYLNNIQYVLHNQFHDRLTDEEAIVFLWNTLIHEFEHFYQISKAYRRAYTSLKNIYKGEPLSNIQANGGQSNEAIVSDMFLKFYEECKIINAPEYEHKISIVAFAILKDAVDQPKFVDLLLWLEHMGYTNDAGMNEVDIFDSRRMEYTYKFIIES